MKREGKFGVHLYLFRMEPNTHLGHYRVIVDGAGAPVEIRRRGASITYKAQDLRSDDEIALEVVSPENFSRDKFEEIEREAGRAQELSHINLPKLHGFGRESDHLLYATEYCDGTSAEDWVRTHGPMPVGPVLRIAIQIVNTLAAATYHGLVHGAINPRNILFVPGQTEQGDWPLVKLLGLFGPAPSFAGAQFANSKPEFTAQFASPEQLQNGPVNFRSELYSLGTTLRFLLTGTAVAGELPAGNNLPKPVSELLEQMLAPDPEQRPHDPVLLEERIRTCLEQAERREVIIARRGPAAVPAPAVVVEEEPWTPPPWRPIALAAVALVLLGILATTFWPASLRPGRLFGSSGEPVGIPIGVPEEVSEAASAAPIVSNSAPPADIAVQPAPASEFRPRQSTQSPRASLIAEAKRARVPPKVEPLSAPAIAERATDSPQSPGEGPAAKAEIRRAESVNARETVSAPPRAELVVNEPTTSRAQPPSVEKPAPAETSQVARASTRPKKINGLEVRPAEPVAPRVSSKRVRRARFLGTTPDGELVFEIPPPPPRR